MNWEAVGAISQIVGTVLVGITLIYLAIQLRQNTSAVKSSTFLAISTLMGSTMEIWATHPDIAPLLLKAQAGLDELSPDERTRFGFVMMMAFRRIETVVVQRHLGFIDRELTKGFERSALSVFHSKGGCVNGGTRQRTHSATFFQHGSMKRSPRTCLDRSMLGLVSEFQRIRWKMGSPNQTTKPTDAQMRELMVISYWLIGDGRVAFCALS